MIQLDSPSHSNGNHSSHTSQKQAAGAQPDAQRKKTQKYNVWSDWAQKRLGRNDAKPPMFVSSAKE